MTGTNRLESYNKSKDNQKSQNDCKSGWLVKDWLEKPQWVAKEEEGTSNRIYSK